MRAFPGQACQAFLGSFTRSVIFIGVFIAQLIQAEGALIGNLDGACDPVRVTRKQTRHFTR